MMQEIKAPDGTIWLVEMEKDTFVCSCGHIHYNRCHLCGEKR
jgi:hypothetical protein